MLSNTQWLSQRSGCPLDEPLLPRIPRRREGLGTYWARLGACFFPEDAFPLVGKRFAMVGLTGLEPGTWALPMCL